MAFRGENEHNLDSKDRLTIPSRHRDQLAEGVVLMKALDPCVSVFPAAAFDAFTKRSLGEINPLGRTGRMMTRRLNAGSFDDSLDSAGRVRIPQGLIEHAGLSGACTVIGVDDHLEIWDPERWAAEQAEIDAAADGLAEELAAADAGG
ncbi:division/cell wall cluster transcriptional repressor MraZ [Thermoleophilia bacterium SCSIO 60948]|nr:division/cell wall cluster transcriptional repressor MraZ [Thermoleophilia bacterium SCSIO 60948]